jgi:ligand-binding sensor domain-containing protein
MATGEQSDATSSLAMKPIPESPLNKIALLFLLSLLLAAGLWTWLNLPAAQAQGGDEDLWRILDTPFENVGQVLEDKDVNIWAVSLTGTFGSGEDIQFIPGQGLAKFEQGRWMTYTVESTNGELPGDSIHAALFDRADNLWLAVAANETVSDTVELEDVGVVRFDGQNWQTFTVTNTNGGLADDSVRDIFEDDGGNLWFATLDGLSRYDGQTWEVVADKDDLGAEGVARVFQDSQNRLWVGLFDFEDGVGVPRGVARSAPVGADGTVAGWQTFTEADGLGHDFVLTMAEDGKGNIWLGTVNGVSRFDGENWETFDTENSDLPGDIVYQVIAGYEGQMWAATDGGAAKYVEGQWQSFGDDKPTLNIFKDSERLVWFSKGNGLSYYTGYYHPRQVFSEESGDLGSNDVRDLFESSDGAIWARTWGGGVSRYRDGQWQTFSEEGGDLDSNNVQDLFESSDGAIWVRTGGGVSRYQDGQWQTFSEEGGDLDSNNVQDLFEASDGAIWARTNDGGVSRYQDGQWQTFSEESGDLGSNNVSNLFEASDGAIWAETRGGGVSRYQDGQWQTFSVESGDLESDTVYDLFEASDGAIWAGTSGGGVSRYHGGEWQTFSVESGDLGSNRVHDLLEASDGAIWAGTGGGVSRYQDGGWQTFSKESGDLDSIDVWSLFEASDGAIWAETYRSGVSCYQDGQWQTFSVESGDLGSNDVRDLFEASDGAIWARTDDGGRSRYQDGEWQAFTYEEYEALDVQGRGSEQRQLADRYGFAWTATDDGLVRSLLPNHRPPWVKTVAVNNVPITITTAITHVLAYDDRRRVLIGLTGDDLSTRPADLQYRYKLENSPVYADWQMADDQPVLFDELDPGEYTLLVKAIDEDGNESEPATLDITVESQPEIREVAVEPRYTIPGLGTFTLPQLLGGGVGLVALLGLTGLGVTLWRRRQPPPLPKEYFNPYIVGKPVTGRNFVGRQDIFADLITALKGDNHLMIEGERRIGKTSLLYELAEALRQDGDYCFIPAYVQLQRVTEEKLFYAIMREIARESRRRCGQLPSLRCEAPYDDYDTFDAEDDLLAIIEALKETTDLPLRVVILLDEGDRLRDFTEETHSHLRGWMGADIQKDVLILVWCGVSFDRAWHQRTSPWYNQFRSAIELLPLSPQEARTLITRPVEGTYEYEDEAIERILTLSQRKPFVIQLVCHECVKRLWQEQSGAIITLADVEAVWPLVQRRLESEEQAEAPSEDIVPPSLTYPTAVTAEQMAEETAPYDTQPEETADDH